MVQYNRYFYSEVVLRWLSNPKHDCHLLFVQTIWLMNKMVLLLFLSKFKWNVLCTRLIKGTGWESLFELSLLNQGHVNITAFVAITFSTIKTYLAIILKLQLSKTFSLFVRKEHMFNFLNFIWLCILLWFLLSYMYRTSVIAVPCPNCILYHAY